jgi:hypothetical protein
MRPKQQNFGGGKEPAGMKLFLRKTGGTMVRTGTIKQVQDLRQKIYVAAKSDKTKRFWGMYCHISKEEVLKQAYRMAKQNNGAPGVDGVTFKEIEAAELENFVAEIKKELEDGTYRPNKNRKQEIRKENGKNANLRDTDNQRPGSARRAKTDIGANL